MVIPSRLFSFWEVAEVVVVDVVTGKEGGVGEAEDVRTAPPGQPPHELGHTNPSPRMYPNTSDGILSDPPRVVPYILHVIRAQQG